ncbi:MAG: MFS transporter [Acidimicrobiales bacterium]
MAIARTTRPVSGRLLTFDTLPFYIGGFLGPFGTMVVLPIYPELRETFDATTAQVNWGFSGYMLPMALFLLVSGTIGERLGRRRVIRVTYLVYAVSALLVALAPTLGWFISGRVAQGVTNAFTTPLLLAGLTDLTPGDRLGRAMGIYASFQALGGALAPFVGGLIAQVDWRLAFLLIALVAVTLSFRPPPGEPRPTLEAPPIRPLLKPRMVALWIIAFTAAAGPVGVALLVGLTVRDDLGGSAAAGGLTLLLGGIAATIAGPRLGALIDRWGIRTTSLLGTLAAVVSVAALGLVQNVGQMMVSWSVAAAIVALVAVCFANLAALAVPDNRGGALSSVLAFRFLGHAVGPLIWVPVFERESAAAAYAGAASLGLVSLVGFALVTARRNRPAAAAV